MSMENKIYVSSRNLLGAIGKWAIEQSPYPRPDNLEKVLDQLYTNTKETFGGGKLGFVTFDGHHSLVKFLQENLRSIPEYVGWNERKNGRQGYGFSGAGHHDNGDVTLYNAKADDDFIDLDALERNVANEISARSST